MPLTADRYGLYIRQPVDETAPQPSGDALSDGRPASSACDSTGTRCSTPPRRNDGTWSATTTIRPTISTPISVRPYRVGMACAFCHVGPHPLNPPANAEEPHWSNLSATIGNQYLRTRRVFGNLLKPIAYFYHVLDSQLPGTLDTSLISSDNINNASTEMRSGSWAGGSIEPACSTIARRDYD